MLQSSERPNDDPKTRLARIVWVFYFIVIGALAVLASREFFNGATGDFIHFYDAANAVEAGTDPYEGGESGYIYPPLLAVLLVPLSLLSFPVAASVYIGISAVLVAVATILWARVVISALGIRSDAALLPVTCLVASFVMIDKVRSIFRLGQTDSITFIAIAGALALTASRPLMAGVLLGVAANLKYHTLAFLLLFLLRRQFGAAAAMIGSAIAAALSTALVFGWSKNLDHLATGFAGLASAVGIEVDRTAARIFPLEWIRSVSFPSAFARFADASGATGLLMLACTGTLAMACCVAAAMLYKRVAGVDFFAVSARHPLFAKIVVLDYTGLTVAVLLFSPQTTARHLFLLIACAIPAAALLLTHAHRACATRADVRTTSRVPLLIALVIGAMALVLPPGGEAYADALHAWRSIGGISIVWLVVLFVTLWYAARAIRLSASASGEDQSGRCTELHPTI